MKSIIAVISVLFLIAPVRLVAQERETISQDSIHSVVHQPDEVDMQPISAVIDTSSIMKLKFKPDPTKALIYSAVCPGLGQIYNRKYWKLPIVYGAFLGCAYAISWNGTQYSGYKNAYSDWIAYTKGEDSNNSWISYLKYWPDKNYTTWSSSEKASFENRLKNGKDYYRRYRDLSYIITAGVYVLTMLDAYVDAELFDFDISQDLSMRVEPVLFDQPSKNNNRSVGLQCSFTF